MTEQAAASLHAYRTEKLALTVSWTRKLINEPSVTEEDRYWICEDLFFLVRDMMKDMEKLVVLVENLGQVLAILPAARGACEGGFASTLAVLQDQLLEIYGKAKQEGLVK